MRRYVYSQNRARDPESPSTRTAGDEIRSSTNRQSEAAGQRWEQHVTELADSARYACLDAYLALAWSMLDLDPPLRLPRLGFALERVFQSNRRCLK